MSQDHADIYRRLGVEPVVNCGSSRSVYGNSTQSDPVRTAMESASHHHVIMEELGDAAGQRLSELTGTEWGLVTAGSATGLALGAAACVASNDPLRMLRLPGPFVGEKWVVLTPKGQRFAYDQSVRMVGAEVVEVSDQATFEAALREHTVVAVLMLAERDVGAPLTFDQMLPAAKAADVPIMVDAASEALTVPERWTARGADMVVYSVSKLMRGPAASGLLLGRKSLVQAAWYNGPPHQGFGRAMKISKEQIMGAIAAVERWLSHDRAAEQRRWHKMLDTIRDRLQPINALRLDRHELAGGIPRLQVDWTRCHPGLTFTELQVELLARRPRILIDDYGGTKSSTMISPFSLDEAGAELVSDALFEALAAVRPDDRQGAKSNYDVSGDWVVSIDFATGPMEQRLALCRKGDAMAATHHTPFGNGEGVVTETKDGFDVQIFHWVEGCYVGYRFVTEGCTADRLSGYVELGAASSHARGPTTLRQFGRVPFEAVR
ncbi:MAG: aminotransferase class V-fold PLP-dependent enzyme [Pseudomonadota bacterium]|nr:aminotransferase class V-fold PLP-dependent enzyme [Pseudomonadota bacterium]